MDIIMHFIFNLSLLAVLQLLGLTWINGDKNKIPLKKIFAVFLVCSLVICFVFRYPLQEELYLDLRYIPFIIGALYAGLSPLLAIVTIALHAIFIGIDIEFWMSCIFSSFYGLLLWKISPWFLGQPTRKRIQFLVQISLCISIVKIVLLNILYVNYPVLDVWFAEIFIQSIGIGLLAFFLEQANKSIQLKKYLSETKKHEAIEQMGATISHEIRNPLTSAIGFVQLLQSQSTSLEKQTHYLSIIRNELKSAERVVENYLALAKQDKDAFQPIHVELELYNVLKLLVPSARASKVYINQHFSESHIIQANQQKFHQCFINLIKNAIESMPNGGILLLEVINDNNHVRIRIQDNGIGMTPEQVSHLGEPYFSTKGEKGTGLGMLVVFNFVKEMNGTSHIESELGKGTIFEIMFSTFKANNTGLDIIENRNFVPG